MKQSYTQLDWNPYKSQDKDRFVEFNISGSTRLEKVLLCNSSFNNSQSLKLIAHNQIMKLSFSIYPILTQVFKSTTQSYHVKLRGRLIIYYMVIYDLHANHWHSSSLCSPHIPYVYVYMRLKTTNLPTWSCATLVVNPSITVGLLRPLVFMANTISLRSRPGLRPVIMKTGLGLDTLASIIPDTTSITSSMKNCSKPPSNPGSHLQRIDINHGRHRK